MITWSPLRHSLNVNGPLTTCGLVFSVALSKSAGFDVAVRYLPKTCVGIGLAVAPPRSRIAAHETLVILTLNFFGLEVSIVTPEIDCAVPLHCVPDGATQKSLKPWMSWNVDLRTVVADLATAVTAVSQSCAMIGLPSDQFALSLIVNVYVRPSVDVVYDASFGFTSPLLASCWTS